MALPHVNSVDSGVRRERGGEGFVGRSGTARVRPVGKDEDRPTLLRAFRQVAGGEDDGIVQNRPTFSPEFKSLRHQVAVVGEFLYEFHFGIETVDAGAIFGAE